MEVEDFFRDGFFALGWSRTTVWMFVSSMRWERDAFADAMLLVRESLDEVFFLLFFGLEFFSLVALGFGRRVGGGMADEMVAGQVVFR